MSEVSERAQEPRLVVDRYKTMDMVSINFILPKGVLKETRGAQIADEVAAYVADKGLGQGHVTQWLPQSWEEVEGGPNVK